MAELMVDIETLATDQDALVLSVGLQVFRRDGSEVWAETVHPSYQQQVDAGRHISLDTLAFWMREAAKDPRAYEEAFVPEAARWPVRQVGMKLQNVVRGTSYGEGRPPAEAVQEVWANGDLFDLGVVTSLLRPFMATPWEYNSPRDLRTLCREAEALGWTWPLRDEELHPKHSAVADCRYQTLALTSARAFLGGRAWL